MLVLALDTTTRQGSVALARDGGVVAVYAGDAAITHGVRLPGDLMRLFDARDLRVADVDLFAVASGPGSFTGLRIGIATMQGFALANSKPLAGVSALDAIVDASSSSLSPQPSALSPDSEVAAWMDAGRGQVFSARYKDGDVVEPALVDKPAEILARWAQRGDAPALFAGDGALAYRDLIRAAVPGRADRRAGTAACAKHRATGRATRAARRAVCARRDQAHLRQAVRCGIGA